MIEHRPFSTFLIRAHRRRIAWRTIEHAGVGLLIGCAISSVILIVSLWRTIEPIAPVIAILCGAAVAGLVASIWRLPALLDTAKLIEGQLKAPELLSSALLAPAQADGEFASALRALADARVAGLSPASLILRRFSSRAWSGVGLAIASVLVLALMISPPLVERPAIAQDASEAQTLNRIDSPIRQAASPSERIDQRDPSSTHSMMDATSSHPDVSVTGSDARSSRTTQDARGTGSARSESAPVGTRSPAAMDSTPPNDGTLATSGVGRTSLHANRGENHSGVVTSSVNPPTAPWRSEGWSRDRDAALESVRNGSVPDSYRSLVQDYFQRP